jgi:hypothetical protein
MNFQFAKFRLLAGVAVLFFCFCAGAAAQETENKLSVDEQRRIIGILLNDKFKNSPEEIIYISTANLPEEISNDFPALKNKTIRLVTAQRVAEEGLCAYEFGEFQFVDKYVSVTFGSCREGLAYDFVKAATGWKGVGLTITRELFY